MTRSTRAARAAAAAVGTVLALAACASSASPESATTGSSASPSASPSLSASSDPSATPSPATLPSTQTGVTAAPTVSREGELPAAQRASAPPAPLKGGTAVYSDGLEVAISGIRSWTVTQQGPGALTGLPATTFTVTVRNGSDKPVDLSSVVVSASYGKDSRAAVAVYDDPALVDLTGTLAPGDKTTAKYAFAVPEDEVRRTVVWVDVDGAHLPATFDARTN